MSELRDWKPGDGMHCKFAGRAAKGFPCGRPVKTRITEINNVRGVRTSSSPLCENHANATFSPSKATAEAERSATQQLVNAHYDEWAAYFDAEVEFIKKRGLS